MQIYRGTLTLLDYLFYATVERGKVYETGAFVHNYALTYAFGLAQAPYSHARQQPNYVAELSGLNGVVYLTPAKPIQISHRLVQWNTIREGYAFPGKDTSIGYPDWGFARVLRPNNCFTFYVLASGEGEMPASPSFTLALSQKTTHIRLGKFMGKAKVTLTPAKKIREKEGDFATKTLLNWRDCPLDPLVCDVLPASLPTRLINNAHFAHNAYYEAHFGEKDVVCLPTNMGYLTRLPKTKKKRGRK